MTSKRSIFGDNPLRTREDAQRAARDAFEPLVPFYAKGGARVMLGETAATYDAASEGLEAFIRPLWALAPLAAGGGSFEHWDLIRQGIINGTDPNHEQYWGAVGATPGINPSTDQRMVEMAAFGLALALAGDEIYHPLNDHQKQNLLDWLAPINTTELRDNNWQFFRVLVNLGFAAVGAPTNEEAMRRSLATLESNYLGNGWYQDGESQRTTDFYIPFAFHFYSLIYAHLAKDTDPELAQTFVSRAREFTPDWESRFDSSGRVIAYGRSMTYRFAGAGYWGALALADVDALPWGRIRALWAQHLRWWNAQSTTNQDGVLTIGWGYPNLLMQESYNAPGSPYWALKAFLPLALPADHPFWTAEEDHEQTEVHQVQHEPGVIVNRTETQSIMLNSGRPGFWFPRHGAAKYGKHAYSSAFPFALEPDDTFFLHTAESQLAFLDGFDRRTRSATDEAGIEGDVAWSRWTAWDNVKVLSVVAGEGNSHVRVHVVDTEREVKAIEGGFAVEYRYDPGTDTYVRHVDGATALVGSDEATTAIADPTGRRDGAVFELQPNTSLQWARSTAPMLNATLTPGRHILTASVAADEGRESISPSDLPEIPQKVWDVVSNLTGETIGPDTVK